MSLTLTHTDHECYVVVAIDGDLDLSTAADFADGVERLIGAGTRNIVLDAEHLTFCDSSGLRVIVKAVNDLGPKGGRLVIANPRPVVLRVLEVTGLTTTVTMVDTVAEAAAELG